MKNKIWKMLAVVNILGAVFTSGMMIGGNTADGLQIYLATAIGILILSFGQDYDDEEKSREEEINW